MRKTNILVLFLVVIMMTGCSYEVTAKNSQKLHGEDENWNVEYRVDFTTIYPQKDGKLYARRMKQKKIIVSYKKDLSNLSNAKHIELSYKDSFGGGGKMIEDFDFPPTKKQFQLGGGSVTESDDDLSPENLHKAILFSSPGYEPIANATATIKIQIDGQTNLVQLSPEKEPSPLPIMIEQVNQKLSKKAFLRFFSGYASDLKLKLVKFDVRIINDKSDSTNALEGEEKGQMLTPATLCYEFTIRNEGRKPISGSFNDLQVKIVPSDRLREISKEAVGTNIFDPDSGFGYGTSISGEIFNIDKDGQFELSFDLSREDSRGTLITPSEKMLEKLLHSADDASFIIIYKNEEAAQFHLNER